MSQSNTKNTIDASVVRFIEAFGRDHLSDHELLCISAIFEHLNAKDCSTSAFEVLRSCMDSYVKSIPAVVGYPQVERNLASKRRTS